MSILFLSILLFFFINFTNSLQSLVVSEFLWITLYVWSLFMAYLTDDMNLLSLTLFFLVFSAIEISVGLIVILIQKTVFRSLNFTYNSNKHTFNLHKTIRSFYSNKFVVTA